MSNSNLSNRKQSIIAGGLISSAGIFFAKFIGLFYAIPYNSMLGSAENIAYYGTAYNIYSYLLNICTAGFPFAIATLIAKYSSRGDYQTSLLIKKLSSSLMACFGFGMMIIVILFSSPLASIMLPPEGDNANTLQVVLILISFALFFVPLLSSLRGFYQGLKHMEVYALSQVLEQIARVAFLLTTSALAVYALNYDNVWALYFGVISTSVSAILAMIHLKLYDKKQMKQFKMLAANQTVVPNKDRREILREIIFLSFPYFLVAILGYSDTIVNVFFLNAGLEAHGNSDSEIILISGAINLNVLKLINIPMILAPGFSSAIIPHITTALTHRDYKLVRKNIRDCIDIVLYIALPISFCLFLYAKPLYFVMFPPEDLSNLNLLAQILSWFSIEAFLNTIGPIFTALMMSVGLRRLNIRNSAIMMTLKLSTAYPLLAYFGYQGVVYSTIIAMGVFIALDVYALTTRYKINWKYTLHKLLIIILAMLGMMLVANALSALGLKGYDDSRFMSMIELGINGMISVLVYFAITYIFAIPQTILNLDLGKIWKRIRRG